ncbi:MAG TPA: NAD-dependent epimerase/dehydratase family protein, partial [Acidimicrobiales bacterium]|nr:NAD-dependent epimerase/dehydratase family protein [Acidimicrobiales bacterium]
TAINRGVTAHDLPDGVEYLVGDRSSDLSALGGRVFDATVDVTAYRPSDVARLAESGVTVGHYVQVSSVSAYADPRLPGATEETAVLHPDGGVDPDAPMSGETYGPLKAAAERAGKRAFTDVAIVRPTYVVGAHDVTLRFPYWVARARRGGTVAVPGPERSAMQYVDARDLGDFVARLVARGVLDDFHVAGPWPATTFAHKVRLVVDRVGPRGTSVEVVSPESVRAQGLEHKFPLWSGGGDEAGLAIDPSKALVAGLTLRPLEDSVAEVDDWWSDREWPGRWLTPDEERSLLG